MHLKPKFEETRTDVLHGLIRMCPLATVVTAVDSRIAIDHVPMLISADGGEHGTLRGHTTRDNPAWRGVDGAGEAVAVFHGPQCYITPSWYPSKRAHGKAVPTWNYVVVHARGGPRIVDDPSWVRDHLVALTDEHETGRADRWRVSDAPEEYTSRIIERLVGIEMPIASLIGKWKVSQNRPADDRIGVAEGLRARGDDEALAMAALVEQQLDEER